MNMALIFLVSVFVVTTHQYFHDQPSREMPWLFPYSAHQLDQQAKQQPILIYSSKSIHPAIYSSQVISILRVSFWPTSANKMRMFLFFRTKISTEMTCFYRTKPSQGSRI
jgi:hypothetical protein